MENKEVARFDIDDCSIFANKRNKRILEELLEQIVFDGLKVYLEGLGIIYTKEVIDPCSYTSNKETIHRKEHKKLLVFEKSYELNSFHHSKFKNLLETKELAYRLHPRLPFEVNSQLNIKGLIKELKKFFENLRSEILLNGKSLKLSNIGTFYALKRLENANWQDNFAQSDIVLLSNKEEIIKISDQYKFKTPIFRSSTEPLEVVYGNATELIKVNVVEELEALGYQTEPIIKEFKEEELHFEVSVFTHSNEKVSDEERIIYCTNGIRRITPQDHKATELTFQTSVPTGSQIPTWPIKLMMLGWILLNSSKNKVLSTGTILNVDMEQTIGNKTNLCGVCAVPFRQLPSLYYCLEGEFQFINILGITDKESNFSVQNSAESLVDILFHKEYAQITKINRRDIL